MTEKEKKNICNNLEDQKILSRISRKEVITEGVRLETRQTRTDVKTRVTIHGYV